jgi:uncharacterized protein (TIRG00374 family)
MKRLRYVLHWAVMIGLVYAGMKFVNGGLFWRAIHQFNWVYAPLILLCGTGYNAVRALRFCYLMRQVNEVRPGVVFRSFFAGQACSILPGGILARAGFLKEEGVPVAESAPAIAIGTLADYVVMLLCSLVAALWFETARRPLLMVLTALVLVSLLLGIEAVRTWLRERIERVLGHFELLDRWRDLLQSMREMARPDVLFVVLGTSAVSVLFWDEALELSLMGVGADVAPLTVLLALTLPSILGRISAMPAGLGVTEAGMVSILNAAPGVTLDQAAAATMLFRIGTVLFQILVGFIVYILGRRATPSSAAAPVRAIS